MKIKINFANYMTLWKRQNYRERKRSVVDRRSGMTRWKTGIFRAVKLFCTIL